MLFYLSTKTIKLLHQYFSRIKVKNQKEEAVRKKNWGYLKDHFISAEKTPKNKKGKKRERKPNRKQNQHVLILYHFLHTCQVDTDLFLLPPDGSPDWIPSLGKPSLPQASEACLSCNHFKRAPFSNQVQSFSNHLPGDSQALSLTPSHTHPCCLQSWHW